MTDLKVPAATYRIQSSRNFKFKAAQDLALYLNELGVTDLYASPIFQARRGSGHGYSVTNPMVINPELGFRSSFDSMVRRLKSLGMGLIIDIVPNHMPLSHENPWWMDVLENGPSSHKFSIDPKSYKDILSHRLSDLEENQEESNPAVIGLKGLVALSEHLPARRPLNRKKAKERQRNTELIKRSLWLLYQGNPAPDPNEEIFLYQTLIGAWPFPAEEVPAFKQRLKNYIVKAAREAGVHTRWITPDTGYENALLTFADTILDEADQNEFLESFLGTQSRLACFGALNSLSQVLLKITSPGAPNFYQGTDLWDFSLVDPDNRRPVDFTKRVQLLRDIKKRESKNPGVLMPELLTHWEDGRIKLYLIYKALHFRRENRGLFLEGEYLPLSSFGSRRNNIVAFSKRKGDQWVLAAVPRLTAKMAAPGVPLEQRVWGKSLLNLPLGAPLSWTNVFTGDTLEAPRIGRLLLHRMFSGFPVALLSNNCRTR